VDEFLELKMQSRKVMAAAILGFAALSASPARASEVTWQGGTSGFWNEGANWRGLFQPTATDVAIFDDSLAAFVTRTAITLDANKTVRGFEVDGDQPFAGAYSFTRSGSSLLTVTGLTRFGVSPSIVTPATPGTATLNNFLLDANNWQLRGKMTTVVSGTSTIRSTGLFEMFDESVLNQNAGSISLGNNKEHLINSGTININGGTFNIGTNSNLVLLTGSSKLNFAGGYNIRDNSTITAQFGGDVLGNSFIDIGSNSAGFAESGRLTVAGAGATFNSLSVYSDWGLGAGSSATVNILGSGVASVAGLQVGTDNAQATVNVLGGTLNVNGFLTAGGGTTARNVQLTLENAGTVASPIVGRMTVNGEATFDNQADLNFNSGELTFKENATFNAGSRLDIAGGTLDITNRSLIINGGTLTRTVASGTAISPGATLIVQAGGTATFSSYFDIGYDNSAALVVRGFGSTLTASGNSGWGFGSAGSATVNIDNGGVVNLNNLGIGNSNGSISVTVASSGQLKPNTLTVGGGITARTVRLTIDGGRVDVAGVTNYNELADIDLVSGTLRHRGTATINPLARLDITGGSFDTTGQTFIVNGGILTRTVTSGAALSSGSTLRVQAGGNATFSSFFDIGSGNTAALTVTGTGSNFSAGGTTDWGFGAAGNATVNIDNNAIATLGTLRIGENDAAASVTVASGGQLKANRLIVGSGLVNRNVSLSINGGSVTTLDVNGTSTFNEKAIVNLQGGTLDLKGNATFFTGAIANWSGGSLIVGNGKTLTLEGGVINRTGITPAALSPGATLAINTAGRFDSTGNFNVGETGAGTVTVDGTGSLLWSKADLNLGSSTFGGRGDIDLTNGGDLRVGDRDNDAPSFDVYVSDADPVGNAGGVLTIANGSTLDSPLAASIGTFSGQSGRVVVNGTDSRWTAGGAIVLGFGAGGQGELLVQSGGLVRAPSIFAGSGGSGSASVSAGGRVETTFQVIVGNGTNSDGTATVTGTNSTLAVGTTLEVGRDGTGTLNIQSAGKVTAASAVVGNNANSIGAVSLNGTLSALDVTGLLDVGRAGNGTLNVQSAGRVNAGSAIVGNEATSVGAVNLSGTNSTLAVAGLLDVGSAGTGTINIQSAGRVTAASAIVGNNANSIGAVNVNGTDSTFAVTGTLEVGSAGNGTLNIQAGGRVTANNTLIGGFANSVGTINVTGTNARLEVTNPLVVGDGGAGTVNINTGGRARARGLVINPSSKIDMGAGGTIELTSTTATALTSIRNLIQTGFNAGNWQGNGVTSSAARTDPRLGIGYGNASGLITVRVTLSGDATLDNVVNFDDLLKLAASYNATGKHWFDGDFTYDGVVNFDDLLKLASNYNQTFSGSLSGDWALAQASVPEPTALALASAIAATSLRRRRR
jgi:T5SS/PEP-CTERM-associated repeat protein